jgi:PAS domain S-box-containing protein
MDDKVNILMVDDQPGKLLSYEVILSELGENLIKAGSASQALEILLKLDIAVILVDVCMPETDGFELVSMIREHPRFKETAIIFISAVQLAEVDHIRAYGMGAVDYVPVPVVPEVLRAKVKVFVELYRKTRQLESFNRELERRVAERTAELEASNTQLLESERRRTIALSAGQMGSWDFDPETKRYTWDEGQYRIFGVDKDNFVTTMDNVHSLVHPSDRAAVEEALNSALNTTQPVQTEFRVIRPDGELRWCVRTMVITRDATGSYPKVCGCTIDITERKKDEERQTLLAREVDHRAKNALAVVQSLVRLTKADTVSDFVRAVDGRVRALASVHTLLSESRWDGASLKQIVSEEMAPYQTRQASQISFEGPAVLLLPAAAQTFGIALHELATNAAKYGALSVPNGHIRLTWRLDADNLILTWDETGGPGSHKPGKKGFGLSVIETSIVGQVKGKVNFEWRPEGLRCEMRMPRAKVMRTIELPPSLPEQAEKNGVRPNSQALLGKRILLAEDEALVGMMVHEMLDGYGFAVTGPIGELKSVLAAAEEGNFDGAILDVNLGGELIYPVAHALLKRGVPFIFVTGYDKDSIEHKFAHVPVLRKPIEAHALYECLMATPIMAVA